MNAISDNFEKCSEKEQQLAMKNKRFKRNLLLFRDKGDRAIIWRPSKKEPIAPEVQHTRHEHEHDHIEHVLLHIIRSLKTVERMKVRHRVNGRKLHRCFYLLVSASLLR
jgi:hypothetical protein